MKKIFLVFCLLIIVFFAKEVNATSIINFSFNKDGAIPEYIKGERVEVSYAVINNTPKSGLFIATCDFVYLDGMFPPMPSREELNLTPTQISDENSCSMSVEDTTPAGSYLVNIKFYDPEENQIEHIQNKFIISGTDKIIEADLMSCLDKTCQDSKILFFVNQDIYLLLKGVTVEMEIGGTVIGDEEEIDLATGETESLGLYKFSNLVVGTYKTNIEISGEGYKDQKLQHEFVIIEKPAEIKRVSVCNIDGKCMNGENEQNCPLDCKISTNKIIVPDEGEKPETKSDFNFRFIVIGAIVLIILLFIGGGYYLFVRKDKSDEYNEGIK